MIAALGSIGKYVAGRCTPREYKTCLSATNLRIGFASDERRGRSRPTQGPATDTRAVLFAFLPFGSSPGFDKGALHPGIAFPVLRLGVIRPRA